MFDPVPQRSVRSRIKLKPDKTTVYKAAVKFRCPTLIDRGTKPKPEQARATVRLLPPTCMKYAPCSNEMINYISRFLLEPAELGRPIRRLTWICAEEQQLAFDPTKQINIKSHVPHCWNSSWMLIKFDSGQRGSRTFPLQRGLSVDGRTSLRAQIGTNRDGAIIFRSFFEKSNDCTFRRPPHTR